LQADAETELSGKQQAYRMAMLEKQNRDGSLYLWVTIAFLVMSLLIVLLVYLSYRRGRKNIAQLTTLKTELEKKDKEKDKIMNIVVHDLRGPVTGIYTVAEIMMAEGERTEEESEWMGMIKSAAESSLELINQLMGYKKESKLTKEPNDIGRLIVETVKLLQLRANEKGILLRKHLPQSRLVVTMDKEKINRVLNNLVINAIKFSNSGSAIDITVEDRDATVLLTIKDAGICIPKHMQPEVFGLFTAAKRDGTEGEKSFGLCLSITKDIVEAHGGKIWLESEEEKGTTFYVELPK